MNRKTLSIVVIVAAAAAVAYFTSSKEEARGPGAPPPIEASPGDGYLLATGTVGGTYYPVGVAIATLIKVKLQATDGIGMSAARSAGSGENIGLLQSGEAEFAILQGLFGYQAWQGTGQVLQADARANLRSITMLWQNVEQILCDSGVLETGFLGDLATMSGEKMAFGQRNSGTIASTRVIVNSLGLDMDSDFDLLDTGYSASVEALQDAQVTCVSIPAGVPTSAVTQAFTALGEAIRFVEMTDDQLGAADDGRGLWTRYIIPPLTYPGQDEPVHTMAQPNFLAVRADVDDDDVYKITKAIYDNLEFIQGIQRATRAMSLARAIDGMPIPLHPGALRYYREVGLDIQDHLIVEDGR